MRSEGVEFWRALFSSYVSAPVGDEEEGHWEVKLEGGERK